MERERQRGHLQPPPHTVTTQLEHAHCRHLYLQHRPPQYRDTFRFFVSGPQIFSISFVSSLSQRMEHVILSPTNNKLLLVSIATPSIPPTVSPLSYIHPHCSDSTVLTWKYEAWRWPYYKGICFHPCLYITTYQILCFSACVTVHPSHCFLPQCSASHNVQFVLPNRADESIRRNADVGSHFCSWNLILLFRKTQKKSSS